MREGNISSAAAVHRWARVAGDTTAIVYEGTEISYAQLSARVRRLAAVLSGGGLRRGDRVAYLGRNSALLLETALAAAHLGVLFLPLSFRLASDEVAFLLDDSGAHTLVVEDEQRALVDGIADSVPVRRFLLDSAAEPAHPRWESLSAAAAPDRDDEPVDVREADVALLMYTSGTTGRPKGALLTHGNLWWNQVNTATAIETRFRDTALVVAPMFHIAGLSGFTLGTLAHGGTLVVRRAFNAEQCLEDLVEHRVANLIAVPTMFDAIARTPGFERADLSALRAAIVGGAPVPDQLVRDYSARGVKLQQAWGLTETAPLATYLPPQLVDGHPGSAGFPMPHTEIRLIDPTTGAVVAEPGEAGEICVRGPNVISGYWNDPDTTRKAVDDAGWFHSGDIGHLDEQGHLYVVDRLKDVIISGGENIYPAEIERLLAEFPGVREVAVVGVPHPKWDETPVVVVCQDGAATLEEIRAFLGERLARFKLPTAVHHCDVLPRNGTGKVDKAGLRARLTGEHELVAADR
ncbi:long-chain fatty acid--CoA ligase [Saccharopolyspora sp. NPDC050389]|uniref:acyl-CoA synthetase n=1 Tax=Saccharopolyspora sp. NPDC050389 TaxID=3155516 RepID=UPI0033F775E6